MRRIVTILTVVAALCSCSSNRRPLPTQAELLRQDSLEKLALEHKAEMMQAPRSPEEKMLRELPLHPLPVTYEEGFERMLPGFQEVAPTMVPSLLGVTGLTKTKAVRLPDKDGIHVFLVGGETAQEGPAVYMVTLDGPTWAPIDQLTLFETTEGDERPSDSSRLQADDEWIDEEDLGSTRVEFSVTSRYEIYMQVVFESYVDDSRELVGVSVYSIGSDGTFYELEKNRLNYGAEEDY